MQNLSEKRLDVEAATSVNVKVRKQKDFRANQENDGNWEDCYCIECPECGGELLLPISLENEKFISHPSCKKVFRNPLYQPQSYTISKSAKNIRYWVWGLVVIVLLVAVYGKFETESDVSPQAVVSNSAMDASVWQVKRYLKKHYLKDPRSYKSIEWSQVNPKETEGKVVGYWVRHKFRAKNSFGGYVVENKVFHLDREGNVIGADDAGLYDF